MSKSADLGGYHNPLDQLIVVSLPPGQYHGDTVRSVDYAAYFDANNEDENGLLPHERPAQ